MVLLGLVLSGCAASLAECVLKQDGLTLSSKGAALAVPNGCRTKESFSGFTQEITCDDGREGYVFGAVPDVSDQSPN